MITFPIQVSDESPFPLENIPFGIFSYGNSTRRACAAIGDVVVDLSVLEQEELLDSKLPDAPVFAQVGTGCQKSPKELLLTSLTAVSEQLRSQPKAHPYRHPPEDYRHSVGRQLGRLHRRHLEQSRVLRYERRGPPSTHGCS